MASSDEAEFDHQVPSGSKQNGAESRQLPGQSDRSQARDLMIKRNRFAQEGF